MKIRGFDKNVWMAALVAVPCLIALFYLSRAIASGFNISPVAVFLVLAGACWFGLDFLEKRLTKSAGPEVKPVFCEWSARIDATTFPADEELTRLSFDSHGLDLESAVGRTFVCMTECADDSKDYYFDGEVVRNGHGRIVIRAIQPDQLPWA